MLQATSQPASSAQETAFQAGATLFITDLKVNTGMAGAWAKLLAAMKQTVQQAKDQGQSAEQITQVYQMALQAADNFLADRGYNTTAATVLAFLKSPFYQQYLNDTAPNDDSDRFVQVLMTSGKIYHAWQALVTQIAQGQADATKLDQFLRQHGFQCSYLQVNESFVKMRNHNMNYWAGSYAYTLVTTPDGKSSQGPLVVVYGGYNFSLDHDKPDRHMNKLAYNNSVLTWQADLLIKYGGTLTFSEITLPTREDPYTGPTFSGALTYAEDDPVNGHKKGDVVQITGRLAAMSADDVNHRLPANEDPSLIDQVIKWINYALLGVFIVKMLVSIGKKYTSFKGFEADSGGAFKDKASNAADRAEASAGEVADMEQSPFRQLDFKGSDMLKDLQLKIDQAASAQERTLLEQQYRQQVEAEKEFDQASEEAADPKGDGWAADLEDAGALML